MNPSQLGAALARLGKGKPKHFSPQEIKRRTDLLVKARERRWIGHVKKVKKGVDSHKGLCETTAE